MCTHLHLHTLASYIHTCMYASYIHKYIHIHHELASIHASNIHVVCECVVGLCACVSRSVGIFCADVGSEGCVCSLKYRTSAERLLIMVTGGRHWGFVRGGWGGGGNQFSPILPFFLGEGGGCGMEKDED